MLTDKPKKQFIIVKGIVINSNKEFLVVRRNREWHLEAHDKWEFPGGKIESRELPEECLTREIHEELGVLIMIREPFAVWDYEYPDNGKFRFYGYLCEILEGEPRSLWHEEILWVKAKNLATLDLLEADKELILLIHKKIASR